MAGRKECFPSQFALLPSFEYYFFCSAHTNIDLKYIKQSQILMNPLKSWMFKTNHKKCDFMDDWIDYRIFFLIVSLILMIPCKYKLLSVFAKWLDYLRPFYNSISAWSNQGSFMCFCCLFWTNRNSKAVSIFLCIYLIIHPYIGAKQ